MVKEEVSPKFKYNKKMKESFARLEVVRESLPSDSRKVLLDIGKNLMQQSYLRDLELHKKLTNMQEIASIPKDELFTKDSPYMIALGRNQDKQTFKPIKEERLSVESFHTKGKVDRSDIFGKSPTKNVTNTNFE